jgi:uncharacterized membrane protein YphA (DoxX/SURF4 family)
MIKQKLMPVLRATAACLLLIPMLTACSQRREFRVAINPDEPVAVHEDVTLDDRVVGYVVAISMDGANRFAVLRVTDRAARNAMRVGVEREQHGGDMRLTSVNVKGDAPLLEPGAIIPTRQPLATTAQKTVANLEDFALLVRDFCTDHPAVGIAVLVVGLLVVIGLLRGAIRTIFCILLIAAAVVTTAKAGPPRPAEVEADIRNSAATVARAEEFAAEARRLVLAGLVPEANASAVRAYFLVDQGDFSAKQNARKIDLISGWRADSEDKEKFHEQYQSFKLRRATAEDSIAEVAAKTPNGLVALYMLERARIQNHIANGDADDKWVLQQLSSLARLGKAAMPLIQAGAVSVDNIDNCRIEQGNIVFANGEVLPLNPKPVTRSIVTVTNTLTIARTNVVRVTTPAPPPVRIVEYRTHTNYMTNVQRVFVERTNFVMVTNPPQVAATAVTASLTGAVSTVAMEHKPTNSMVAATHEPPPLPASSPPADGGAAKATHLPFIGKIAVVLAMALLVIAMLVFGVASNARQHPAMIELAEAETGSSQGIFLAGSNEVLVLDDAPHSAPNELRGGHAAIGRDWFGRAVLLAVEGTSINGQTTRAGKFSLNPGDRVTLAKSSGGQTWIFGGINSVQSPTLEEQIEANS